MYKHRQIVKTLDVQVALGKSKSTSAKILRTIKKELDKLPHQPITIEEFSTYYGFDKSLITNVIISNDQNEVKQLDAKHNRAEEAPVAIQELAQFKVKKDEPYVFSRRTS